MRRLSLLLGCLSLLAITRPVRGSDTLGSVIESVRLRAVWIDSARFPTSVLIPLADDAHAMLASLSEKREAETMFVLSALSCYALPSDYGMFVSVWLNRDPSIEKKSDSREKALRYIPPDNWGKEGTLQSNRPEQWTVFGDSLHLNVGSATAEAEQDTVRFLYIAKTRHLTAVGDTIVIPDRLIPLLKEYLFSMCFDRVTFQVPGRDATEQRLLFIEQKLLGRPQDEK